MSSKLITLDQAFNEENLAETETKIFNLNKYGIYDPEFFTLVRANAKLKETIDAVAELEPKPNTIKVKVQ